MSVIEMKYRDAGVDIDKGNQAKQRIQDLVRSTFDSGVVRDFGSFAGLYRPDLLHFQKPILVSSADGVGTKLKIAFLTGIHHTVGVDLVAHCSNDILTHGSLPLFFLDYIATGTLEPSVVEQIVQGLVEGCKEAGCVLLGGETAEMPDFYQEGEYDLAGFMVGLVDEFKVLDARDVSEGDRLIGLPSSGLHTNGYSLVRRLIFEQEKLTVDTPVAEWGKTVGEELLTPHRNYLSVLRELLQADDLHAIAHITGGGITENLARVLPPGLGARIQDESWEVLPVFRFIQERGRVETEEMRRTFNLGLGMILVTAKERYDRVVDHLKSRGETYYTIGEIVKGSGEVQYQ